MSCNWDPNYHQTSPINTHEPHGFSVRCWRITLSSSCSPPDETDQGDRVGNITSLQTDDAANLTELVCQAHYVWAIPLKVSRSPERVSGCRVRDVTREGR